MVKSGGGGGGGSSIQRPRVEKICENERGWWSFIQYPSSVEKVKKETYYEKENEKEKEKENEEYYVPLLVFFDENLKLALAFFFAPAFAAPCLPLSLIHI